MSYVLDKAHDINYVVQILDFVVRIMSACPCNVVRFHIVNFGLTGVLTHIVLCLL